MDGLPEIVLKLFCFDFVIDIIQLMAFDEVYTRIDQPMEHDIH